jgi:ubiquinone/menaquinone biosynthesis C-methylase UbiE
MNVPEEALQKSHAVWERMAPGWERKRDYLWGVTNPVGRSMVDALDLEPGATILDLACGPGDIGFLALEAAGPEGKLIATDFSAQMVEVARRRGEKLGLDRVEYREMNAEAMDLPDDSVDAIVCRWGFMLMLDPQTALKESRRVLRDSGRLSFSVWGTPEKNPWITVMGMVMTQEGHPPQGDPWGPGGMFSMADPKTIETMVKDAGFENVRTQEVPVEWTFADFDEIWSFVTELAGALAALVRELPEDKVGRLRASFEEAVQTFRHGDHFMIPGVTINALAS